MSTLVKRNCSTLEVEVPDLVERVEPELRNVVITNHYTEYTTYSRRVTVRVLTTSCRDVNRFCEITLTIEKTDSDERCVDLCVDVEVKEYTLRTSYVLVPLLVDLPPALLPVIRILLVALAYVVDTLVECTLSRDWLKCHVNNLCRIVALEGS